MRTAWKLLYTSYEIFLGTRIFFLVTSGKTKYFEGELTDGVTSLRFVGFDAKQQKKLMEFQDKKQSVALVNCEVKPNKWSSELEVVMSNSTQVVTSPTKFDITMIPTTKHHEEVSLDQLQDKTNYQRITVLVKILDQKEVMEIHPGLSKQDCIVGDSTGTTTLTLWEDNIGQIDVGMSYRLSGVIVRSFNGKNYLSVPKDNCEISIIDDIENVKEIMQKEVPRNLKDAVVVGIMSLEIYNNCIACKGKVKVLSSNIGQCNKCNMKQRLDRCKPGASAKLLIENAEQRIALTAFTTILREICQHAVVNEETLLDAEKFNLSYSETNIITDISRN